MLVDELIIANINAINFI